MTEPESEQRDDPSAPGLTGAVLWSGVAWLAVAALGLVPTALLFVRGITAMIGYMVGTALVALPLYTVFQLWYSRTVAAAVRSALSSFGLAAFVLAVWTAGRGFDWTVAGMSAVLIVPGALSLLAARQLHLETRARATASSGGSDEAAPVSPAEAVVIALIVVAVFVAAYVVLEPSFSGPIPP